MPKSLSVERTFTTDAANFREVRDEARAAVSELVRRVKSSGYTFKVGGIKIRFARGFETHTREKTLISQTDSEAVLQETVDSLLDEFQGSGRVVRLIGVRVAGIQQASESPSSLDDWTPS